jgi:hypothetical protein
VVDLDGGGPPAVPPNGVALCPAGCNYQSGSGCSGAMSSCLPTLVASGAAKPMCNAAGAVANDGACKGATDCVAGHICVAGTCRKLCCGGDWTGCDNPSEHCLAKLRYETDAGVIDTGAMICLPANTCDALSPATCTQPGTSCQIVDPTGATGCIPEGTGTAGKPCLCKGGFTCVTPPGKSPVCVRLCKAVPGGGSPYCQPNEGICTHYTRDPAGVGECQPPS